MQPYIFFITVQTCLKSNELAIRYGQVRDCRWVGSGAKSMNFAEYKPKYFSRRDKSAKNRGGYRCCFCWGEGWGVGVMP